MFPAKANRLKIVRIAGDGVGPELVAAGARLIAAAGLSVDWVDAPAGLAALEQYGAVMPSITLEAIRVHRIAVKGPFSTPSGGTIRSPNYYLRRELDLYACVRPLPVDPQWPVLLVRENVEDLYAAIEWMCTQDVAHAIRVTTRAGCLRILKYAFDLARKESRKKVTLVHKANNLKLTEGMFLDIAGKVAAQYPDIIFDDMLADTACSTMVLKPSEFDVIVTSNTFGDLLSNIGAAVAGSVGLVGSLNSGGNIHVAEAAHGDAAELAGRDQVNPLAFLESIRLLLDVLGYRREGAAVGFALRQGRMHGPCTFDLGGAASTSEVVDFVCRAASDQLGIDRG
jgi:isocitrate dehydrogenase (NAD+)